MMSPAILPYADASTLLASLLPRLASQITPDLPRRCPVIVPSIQFSDWLQVQMAQRQGVCMGMEFLMPQDFIGRVMAAGGNEGGGRAWSQEMLCWKLLPMISRYSEQLGVREPSVREAFALARLLADQFDQYAHFRGDWFIQWERGKEAWGRAGAQEAWQRQLWREVRERVDAKHPALMLKGMDADPSLWKKLVATYPRLFVVGTGSLDPLLACVLERLARAGCHVEIHIVLPSLRYLGDMKAGGGLTAMQKAAPEDVEMIEGHPLLVSMGRHAVGTFLLLGNLDENYSGWPDALEEWRGGKTLLGRVQEDIRNQASPKGNFAWQPEDVSLRIHACHGPRREMEVLRDELLRAFQDITDLKPEDVVIVTPSLETYGPTALSILEKEDGALEGLLGVRLTELPASEQDPVIEGLLVLLEMAQGRCSASDLLELLHLRSVQSALELDEKESDATAALRRWIQQSGLTEGLDAEDRALAQRPKSEVGTWQFARDRWIAGTWFGEEAEALYPVDEGQVFVLPMADCLETDIALLRRFTVWNKALAEVLGEWKTEASPREWGERLGRAARTLLCAPDSADSLTDCRWVWAFLLGLDCNETLDARTVGDWLQERCEKAPRRASISGKITFGRFKQMQHIPCRVLAMVGMQDQAFPRQNRSPSWDLLRSDPRPWDRNARVDDRQLFLDALLTPTERLIITASTQNVRTGQKEPFSSCVDELRRVVKRTVADPEMVEEGLVLWNKLQPFAAEYFQTSGAGLGSLRSFDQRYAQVARSLAGGGDGAKFPFWQAASSETVVGAGQPEEVEVTLEELIDFWKNPARPFLKAQGIQLVSDEEDEETFDRVPLVLEHIQEWQLKRSLLELGLRSMKEDYTRSLQSAGRALPPGYLGDRVWRNISERVKKLVEMGQTHCSHRREQSVNITETIKGVTVRLSGQIAIGEYQGQEVLVNYIIGKSDDPKHRLPLWIRAVVAAACDPKLSRKTLFFCLDNAEVQELAAIPYDDARLLLGKLFAGWIEGRARPLCFAPDTSCHYIKLNSSSSHPDEQKLRRAAKECWSNEGSFKRSPGEGCNAAARKVWRDQDPFVHLDHWHRWAVEVAAPLSVWCEPPKGKDKPPKGKEEKATSSKKRSAART
jgi:exodeoxyribonuclease V gamma subunit